MSKSFFLKIRGFLGRIKRKLIKTRDEIRFKRSLKNSGYNGFLIGTPTHTNIGDSAIVIAEKTFIKSLGTNIIEITFNEYNNYFEIINAQINKSNKPVFFHGGGNMGNQWLSEELFRRNQFPARTPYLTGFLQQRKPYQVQPYRLLWLHM